MKYLNLGVILNRLLHQVRYDSVTFSKILEGNIIYITKNSQHNLVYDILFEEFR